MYPRNEKALILQGRLDPSKRSFDYERGWPSYYDIHSRMNSAGIRGAQIFIRKLALNSSDFALSECAVHPLWCVTKVSGLASTENTFYEHLSKRSVNIELQKCTVIAIYFVRARS